MYLDHAPKGGPSRHARGVASFSPPTKMLQDEDGRFAILSSSAWYTNKLTLSVRGASLHASARRMYIYIPLARTSLANARREGATVVGASVKHRNEKSDVQSHMRAFGRPPLCESALGAGGAATRGL